VALLETEAFFRYKRGNRCSMRADDLLLLLIDSVVDLRVRLVREVRLIGHLL
jgi:hypothetical protein